MSNEPNEIENTTKTPRTLLWFFGVLVLVGLPSGFFYAQWRLSSLDNTIDKANLTITTTKTTAISSTPKPNSVTATPGSSPSSTTTVTEQQTTTPDKLVTFERDRVDLETKIMAGVVQLLGGIFLATTAYVAWRNLQETRRNVELAQKNLIETQRNIGIAEKNLKATEDKNIAERYTKAIEQLGSGEGTIRVGGIYALEQIAKVSERDHWTIMEVLSSFIRGKSKVKTEQVGHYTSLTIAEDIQAAITVIGRRTVEFDPPGKCINLVGANLELANLKGVCLRGAKLEGAIFRGAKIHKAVLSNINFEPQVLEQIQSAYGWKEAFYSADIVKQLGLPSEQIA